MDREFKVIVLLLFYTFQYLHITPSVIFGIIVGLERIFRRSPVVSAGTAGTAGLPGKYSVPMCSIPALSISYLPIL